MRLKSSKRCGQPFATPEEAAAAIENYKKCKSLTRTISYKFCIPLMTVSSAIPSAIFLQKGAVKLQNTADILQNIAVSYTPQTLANTAKALET